MNNLDIVLALFTTLNHNFLFQTGFSRTLPSHKINVFNFQDCIKFIRLIIYDELSLLYHLFEGVCFGRRRRVAVLKS
jgi:hypothetical protein